MNPMASFSQMVGMLQTIQLTNIMMQAVLPTVLPQTAKGNQEEPTIVAAGTRIDGKVVASGATAISNGRVFKAL